MISKLQGIDFIDKNVLILGCPASGKTYLSNLICNRTHLKLHTDDFMLSDYGIGLYGLLTRLSFIDSPTLIEGVGGYRLIRKGAELAQYYADIIIKLSITQERQNETYAKERDEKKLKYLKTFNEINNKILKEGLGIIPNHRKPEIIEIFNSY